MPIRVDAGRLNGKGWGFMPDPVFAPVAEMAGRFLDGQSLIYPLCKQCHNAYDAPTRPGAQGSKHGQASLPRTTFVRSDPGVC